jgi:hypothetical protein
MTRHWPALVLAIPLLTLSACAGLFSLERSSPSERSPGIPAPDALPSRSASTEWVQDTYAKLPLSFEANVGQTDAQVDFLAHGSGYTLFLSQGDAVLALRARAPSPAKTQTGLANARATEKPTATVGALRMRVLGGDPAARATPEQQLPGSVNYFIGNDPMKWRVGVPSYPRITYPEIYPGIDLVYYGNQGRLEYDFVVAPGADPSAIALRYEGAHGVDIDARGDLRVRLGERDLRQTRPVVHQDIAGQRHAVPGAFVLRTDRSVGFEVGAFDPTRPLVIDPTLVYSTYLGGSGDDHASGIAVDGSGSAYVIGTTGSTGFPTTVGAFDASSGGDNDAFVTKLNPLGTGLVYSTYLGGSGVDLGEGIALDSSGSAYVTGLTGSANFPTTPGAFDASNAGGEDAFVAKLNPLGTRLDYSTYLGGIGADLGTGVSVDGLGSAYVTGRTILPGFPTTPGAFDMSLNGDYEAFVTKLNPLGTGLVYSTYLGGSAFDGGYAIALDSSGSAYVTGETFSTDFPTTMGAFDTNAAGGGDADAFVAKLNPLGTGLIYSTFLGGGSGELGFGIEVDGAASAYVTGQTSSADFPTTAGAFDTSIGRCCDAFVTKLNPVGTGLIYSTYLGGDGLDTGYAIAVDRLGSAYVSGGTTSADFPTTEGAVDTSLSSERDAFVAKLNPLGRGLIYSTYLGGTAFDEGYGVALDVSGSAYVTGATLSADFPTTAGAFDTSPGGDGPGGDADAFVTKVVPIGSPTTLTIEPPSAVNPVGDQHCVTATARDAGGNPTPNVTVRFSVVGAEGTFSTPSSGTDTTDSTGQATFCFTAALPGDNVIHAFADTDNDATQDPGEPTGVANKTWTVPPSTVLCEVKVTNGGQITALNGDRATFGGVAKSDGGRLSGNENYRDHGPAQPLDMKSTQITAVTCTSDRMTAQIFGDATIDGSGPFKFRIRVTDNGEPGHDDIYGIILSNGYASLDQTLEGGNVQIH